MLDEVLDETINSIKKEVYNISDQVNKLLEVMESDIPYSANKLMNRLNIKIKDTLRCSYLNPTIEKI